MYPHRIRLRGPWQCEPLGWADEPVPASRTVTLPARWADVGLPGFTGRVRFRRRFGYPGQIDAHERVYLTFAGIGGRASLRLNDSPLGEVPSDTLHAEFEVTTLLGPRNELVIDVEGPAEDGGLWGEVALEIRCAAFLRDVSAWAEGGQLHVAGTAAGTADRPLDLYALLGRFNAAYTTIEPTPEGKTFHLVSETMEPERFRDEAGGPAQVQVDLVNGAVVWYTWRGELTVGGQEPQGR
jgi:hypothetical protein